VDWDSALAFLGTAGARFRFVFPTMPGWAAVAVGELVITGEGAIDQSTLMGKGVGQVALGCRRAKVPCIGLAGTMRSNAEIARTFTQVRALTEIASVTEAKTAAANWLEKLAESVARDWES
jgi:glycerate kinase